MKNTFQLAVLALALTVMPYLYLSKDTAVITCTYGVRILTLHSYMGNPRKHYMPGSGYGYIGFYPTSIDPNYSTDYVSSYMDRHCAVKESKLW